MMSVAATDNTTRNLAHTASAGAISNVWPRAATRAMVEIVGHATNTTGGSDTRVVAIVAGCAVILAK
jgi:hypothetical protein